MTVSAAPVSASGSRVAYFTNAALFDPERGEYVVAKVTENQPGYVSTYGALTTVAEARAFAEHMNVLAGIGAGEAVDVVLSSMRQQWVAEESRRSSGSVR